MIISDNQKTVLNIVGPGLDGISIYTGGDETPVWANFMDDQVSEGRHGIRASGFINQESNESDSGP